MLCVTDIQQLKTQKGLALEDILTEIHLVVNRLEIPPRVSSQLLINLASIEERLADGCVEKPQITALIAAFSKVRSVVV